MTKNITTIDSSSASIGHIRNRSRVLPAALLTALCFVAPGADAATCFSPVLLDQDAKATTLTPPLQKAIGNFFERMEGNWRGKAESLRCKGTIAAPRRSTQKFRIRADIDVERAASLRVDAELAGGGRSRREVIRLFTDADRLRVDSNNAAGNTQLLHVDGSQMEFARTTTFETGTGTITRTTVVRRLTLSGSRLKFDFFVYRQGLLDSHTSWVLEKK